MKILVSNCLLGVNCRYDGKNCFNKKVLNFIKGNEVIGVCPEDAGGLPTPRQPAEKVDDKIIAKDGKDVTKEYNRGADYALQLAKNKKVDLVILKSNSPSCGKGKIYDGTFSGNLTDGYGVTAKLLIENGFKVITENDIE